MAARIRALAVILLGAAAGVLVIRRRTAHPPETDGVWRPVDR